MVDNEMPAFEDEAFEQKKNSIPTAATPARNTSKPEWQPHRSDGISNHSNKTRSQGLSIPAEFVDEQEVEIQDARELRRQQIKARPARPSPLEKPQAPRPFEEEVESPMTDVPWYLQSQHQTTVFNKDGSSEDGPMFERQRIPDLPVHPPKNLDAILKQLSVEIGLDYLSILDLRKLDPPPALGSNLIMLFGTARGEKHLNVSAERFCTWLRREYKWSPYADGLLGRNELKIKQRRKEGKPKKWLGPTNRLDKNVK